MCLIPDNIYTADDVVHNLSAVKSTLPKGVELVAVSKFHPVEMLMAAYDAGQLAFGESRVQELLKKIPAMPGDVRWHFIGHLQRNKVKDIVGRVALIESVDSTRLLDAIDRESVRAGVVSRVLMQVHVAAEDTKFGFAPEELLDYFSSGKYRSLRSTHLCGIMGMATNTNDEARIKADFEQISFLRCKILELAKDLVGFDIVSMGMSDDYKLAIAAGSTLVRVGTSIFGPRQY